VNAIGEASGEALADVPRAENADAGGRELASFYLRSFGSTRSEKATNYSLSVT
jgi:hypothetical protein